MSNKYKKYDIEPSAEFLNSLGSGIGSSCLECSCGREHYAPNSFSNSEITAMNKKKKLNPDGVVIHIGFDGISSRVLNGLDWVTCCECNTLGKYEQFIWEERDIIRRYLKAKSERLLQEAQVEIEKTV